MIKMTALLYPAGERGAHRPISESPMSAGQSARAQAATLHAEAERIRAEAGHWERGADGEERVGALLDANRSSMCVLHDRLLSPGTSDANLDHLVVCAGGVFLVDTKNWVGDTTEYQGSLMQHFNTAQGRQTLCKNDELRKVRRMADRMAKLSGLPVIPVVCLAGEGGAKFAATEPLYGVNVVPMDHVVPWLQSRPRLMSDDRIPNVAVELGALFPDATTGPLDFGTTPAVREADIRPAPRRRARSLKPRTQRTPRSPNTSHRVRGLVLTFVALVAFATIGPRVLTALGHTAAKAITNAANVATPAPTSTLSATQKQALDDWTIRAGLYRDNAKPAVLTYVPDSGLGAYSAVCKTQEMKVGVYRKGLLNAPDTQLVVDTKQYDVAIHQYLEACRKNEPVEFHHAAAAITVAAQNVNIRYNRLIGRDPAAYNAAHIL